MGLKVWLPLNGDLKNLGTAENTNTLPASYTWASTGKIGNSALYTNTQQAELFFPDLVGVSTYTVAYWVYIPTDKTYTSYTDIWNIQFNCNGTIYLERDERRSASSPNTHNYHMAKDTAAGANTNAYFGTSDRTTAADAWAHMALVKNDSAFTLYENGIQIGSWPASRIENAPRTMTGIVRLGQNGAEGYLQDFRIYDECLSAAQVHEIARGLVLHYKLDGPMSGGGRNLFRNTNFFKTATNSSPASTTISPAITFADNLQNLVGKTITFSFELYTPGARQNNPSQSNATLAKCFGAHLSLNYTPSGGSATQLYPCIQYLISTITEPSTRVIQTYTVPSDCTINSFKIAVQPYAYPAADNTATWKIGQFKVEYGDKATSYSPAPEDLGIDTTIVTDSSGYGHNGTINSTISYKYSQGGRYSTQVYIGNETPQSIDTPNIMFENMQQGTLNIWINRKSFDTNWRLYAYFANGYNWTGREYDFLIIGSTGSQTITLDCCSNTYNFTPDLNKWYMYTISWDLDTHTAKMYVNGELKSIKVDDKINTTYASKHSSHYFGNRNITNSTYVGDYLLSDARIYCTPLLDTDIKLLYNVGSRIDNLGGIHTYEANENDNNTVSKITEVGQLKSKNIYEQPALLNNATSASYSPNGNNNSCLPYVLWADFTPFYQLGQSIRVQVEADITWSNITPTGSGTFKSWLQGSNYIAATNTWGWTTGASAISNYDFTSLMTENATGSVHVSYKRTVTATWLEQNLRSQFGLRTDYATGTISISNLKVTLIPGTAKINTNYVSGTEIIEM